LHNGAQALLAPRLNKANLPVDPDQSRALAAELSDAPLAEYEINSSHPDSVSLSKLKYEVATKLDYLENKFRLKFPKWFRTFTGHACMTMQTTNPTRLAALGNEMAEAFREHFRAYAPWLEKPFYYSMWGITLVYLAVRNLMVAIRGGGMALAKTAAHDLVSEAFIPPLIVLKTNAVQNWISKKLLGIKSASFLGHIIHALRPFSSMAFGAYVMKFLDRKMVKFIPKIFAKVPEPLARGIDKLVAEAGAALTRLLVSSSDWLSKKLTKTADVT